MGHRHQEAGDQAQGQRSAGVAGHRLQGLIHSPCAAGVALVRLALLVLGQAATGDAPPAHKPKRGARGILGRFLEEAGMHVAVVEGCSHVVAVVGVRWIDGDARRRRVVALGGSRFRRLAEPAAVAGAVVVVDSPRS